MSIVRTPSITKRHSTVTRYTFALTHDMKCFNFDYSLACVDYYISKRMNFIEVIGGRLT